MPDAHDHEYVKTQAFDDEANLAATWKTCRICGEDDPDNPKPEIPEAEE